METWRSDALLCNSRGHLQGQKREFGNSKLIWSPKTSSEVCFHDNVSVMFQTKQSFVCFHLTLQSAPMSVQKLIHLNVTCLENTRETIPIVASTVNTPLSKESTNLEWSKIHKDSDQLKLGTIAFWVQLWCCWLFGEGSKIIGNQEEKTVARWLCNCCQGDFGFEQNL